MTRYIGYDDLYTMGIFRNRVGVLRAVSDQGFPPGQLITPNSRKWKLDEVEEWLKTRPTSRKASTRKPAGTSPELAHA